MTSDFRLQVEIWLSCACAVKNMHYNPYLWWRNRQNACVVQETWVEEHDGNVIF